MASTTYTIKDNKQMIRTFMQLHYTDEKLAGLLAHARDGKLAYISCCCFIGAATADHALQGRLEGESYGTPHYRLARDLDDSISAEWAYGRLAPFKTGGAMDGSEAADEKRRRIIIPMIRAEMKRREKRDREIEFEQIMRNLQNDLQEEMPVAA